MQVSGVDVNDKDLPLDIRIYTDEKNGTITIQDTGIGMTKKEMEENLGVIARSGSKNFLKKAKDEVSFDSNSFILLGKSR